MKFFSINKKFLSAAQFFSKSVTSGNKSIDIPGQSSVIIKKPGLKTNTDRGNQLIAWYNLKKLFILKKRSDVFSLADRLDVILFYLHFSTSIVESREFIKNGWVEVNGEIITDLNYKVQNLSIIKLSPVAYNILIKNNIAHSIKQLIVTPSNLYRLNILTGYKLFNGQLNNLILPRNISIPLLLRAKKTC